MDYLLDIISNAYTAVIKRDISPW